MNRETQHVIFLTKNQVDRQPELDLDDNGELPKKEEEEEEKEDDAKKQVTKKKSDKRKEFDRKCLDKFVRKREEKKEARLEEEIFKGKV
ncbi:coiled-coil domain-containing protein 137-like, partial [Pyxicephalus adspersus]|uniref:coiled-coil domain-containing protein 137-like n=1 Tax=Pyxicephalus adspersus TaxID=30357 RepID=UPI003B597EAD